MDESKENEELILTVKQELRHDCLLQLPNSYRPSGQVLELPASLSCARGNHVVRTAAVHEAFLVPVDRQRAASWGQRFLLRGTAARQDALHGKREITARHLVKGVCQ